MRWPGLRTASWRQPAIAAASIRIHDDGTWADVAHLEASQVTGFAELPAKASTSAPANSGRLYLLSHGPAAEGTYTSEVFDAGVFAQWGRAEVELGAGIQPSAVQLFARAGNIENPDRAWGDWKQFTPNSGAVGIPSSRFMQWKVVEHPGTVPRGGRHQLPAREYAPGGR